MSLLDRDRIASFEDNGYSSCAASSTARRSPNYTAQPQRSYAAKHGTRGIGFDPWTTEPGTR